MIRALIDFNIWLSRQYDRVFSRRLSGRPLESVIAPMDLVKREMSVADVGGGKKPVLDRSVVKTLNISYFGLDIDAEELARAPAGTTLRDSRPEAFSDGVLFAGDEGDAAYSNSAAQVVEACPEP